MIVDLHTSNSRLEYWHCFARFVVKSGRDQFAINGKETSSEIHTAQLQPTCRIYDGLALSESEVATHLQRAQETNAECNILLASEQTSSKSLKLFDGILSTNQVATEMLKGQYLGPVETLRLRPRANIASDSGGDSYMTQAEVTLFSESLAALVKSIAEWSQIMPLCDTLAVEARFLGISEHSPVIQTLSRNLDVILSALD